MFFLILLSITVGNIYCIGINVGNETQSGHWNRKHDISLPVIVGGETYFLIVSGKSWFIQELRRGGIVGTITSKGTYRFRYVKGFQFNYNGRQFIYAISDQNYWFIQEILPGGVLGQETDNGDWESKPTIIFSLNVHGDHYVFSLTNNDWFIKKLKPNGQLSSLIDEGSWRSYYTLGFPFSINGRQYIYCLSDNKYWFIQEIKDNGKMGKETDRGHWTLKHLLYFPFNMYGKQYFYGLSYNSKTYWFIQELLPGGKMGSERTNGTWKSYYNLMFPFKIDGSQYYYGVSEYYWFIQQLIQEPALRPISANMQEYCNQYSNRGYCTCSSESRGLTYVEEFITDIRNDEFYTTIVYDNPTSAINSYSLFLFPANNHNELPINLTVAIEAEIHSIHLNNSRRTISRAVRNHLRNLYRESDDEVGYLLAASLGGPGLPFNLAPKSPLLNRRVSLARSLIPQPGWNDVECFIRDYIRATDGYVRWSLAVLYDNLQNSRRPTDFALSVRLYTESGRLTDWLGFSTVTAYHFRNVPTEACINCNHPWWNQPY